MTIWRLPKLSSYVNPGDEILSFNSRGSLHVKGLRNIHLRKCYNKECRKKSTYVNYKVMEDNATFIYFMLCRTHQVFYITWILLQDFKVLDLNTRRTK